MCPPVVTTHVGVFNCFLKDDPDIHRFSTAHMVVGKSVNTKVIHCGFIISQTGEHQPERVIRQPIILLIGLRVLTPCSLGFVTTILRYSGKHQILTAE